jgi:hypothetical protein
VKLVVVGGGSTYTPELVDGIAGSPTRCRSANWSWSTPMSTGWSG